MLKNEKYIYIINYVFLQNKSKNDCKKYRNLRIIIALGKEIKIIIDELQNYLANNITEMKTYQVVMYQEIMQEIAAEKQRLTNKYYGGLLSAQTKQINKTEEELNHWKTYAEELEDNTKHNTDCYYFVDKCGFSVNYMYSWNNGKVVKSNAYHRWINDLHLDRYMPRRYPEVDFTQPIRITILFGQKENMDTNNLGKAIIDQLAEYYGFDDALVYDTRLLLHSFVDSFDKGYMYINIENIRLKRFQKIGMKFIQVFIQEILFNIQDLIIQRFTHKQLLIYQIIELYILVNIQTQQRIFIRMVI